MSRRGPKPEPASVRIAKGNSARRRIGADPVQPIVAAEDGSSTPAPAWLKGEGLEIWERLAPRLVAMKLIGPADCETFGRYCRFFARWLAVQKLLDDEDMFYEIGSKHLTTPLKRRHPAFDAAIMLDRRLESFEDRFGLNPAERQRLFAARLAAGNNPDLFGHMPPPKPDPASQPASAASSIAAAAAKARPPIGFLNS